MKNTSSKLYKRFIGASKWVILGVVFSQLLRFSSNLILTRLLAPEMFGIIAIAMLVIVGLSMFSDVGLRQNIIHSGRGDESNFLNTAWIVQIVRGAVLCVLVLFASLLLVQLNGHGVIPEGLPYSEPVLPLVIAVLSILPLIEGFSSTRKYVLNRNLFLGRITILDLISQFVGILVMVAFAWFEKSIWAIIVGNIVTSTLKTILSYVMLPGESNRFQWDAAAFHEIYHFGKWIFLSSLLGFLSKQGDRIILGGLITSEQLGIYSIAFFLSSSVLMFVNSLSSMTILPVLSEIVRTRKDELASSYYKIRFYIDVIVLFVTGFLIQAGPALIDILYDDRYASAGKMLSVLAFSMIGIGFIQADKCFVALGRMKSRTVIIAIRVLSLYVFMSTGYYISGLYGALWGFVFSIVPQAIFSLYLMDKYKLLNIKRELIAMPMLFVGLLVGWYFSLVTS